MQNSLVPFDIEDAIEKILVPGKILKARDKALRIIEQAQDNASKLVKLAHFEAKKISEAAFSEGFQAGIMMSFESVAEYLQNSDVLYHQFYNQVNDSIRHNLEKALEGDKVFRLVIENWLQKVAQENPDSNHPLILLIPIYSPNIKKDLLEYIKTFWKGEVQVHQHEENRFVIKHANKIAEFSPEQWISHQKIKADYLIKLEQQLSCLSKQAVHELINSLSKKLIKE